MEQISPVMSGLGGTIHSNGVGSGKLFRHVSMTSGIIVCRCVSHPLVSALSHPITEMIVSCQILQYALYGVVYCILLLPLGKDLSSDLN